MIDVLDLEFSAGQRLPAADINTIVDKVNQIINVVNQLIDSGSEVTRAEFDQAVQALSEAIAGKASQSSVTSLSNQLASKASQDSLAALSDQVVSKASQSSVTALSDIVNQLSTQLQNKANQTDLQALADSVAGDVTEDELRSALAELQETLIELINEKASNEALNDAVQTLTDAINEKLSPEALDDYYTKAQLNDMFDHIGEYVSEDVADIREKFEICIGAIKNIWTKLANVTGELYGGIQMLVTPNYFFGTEGAGVHIEAQTTDLAGIFESIHFYWDDDTEPFAGTDKPTDIFITDTEIFETKILVCKAKILGIEYTVTKKIYHGGILWIGGGANYMDVLNDDHKYEVDNCCMRFNTDVSCRNNDHIIVILGTADRDSFQRADMNGVEIEFTNFDFEYQGTQFTAFVSVNTYSAGVYNIDING